ncbi:TIM-barrel domain-containing protein [Actinomadura monticuli]|uniref:Glycoside hydrolase family 31 protein n=1 Tax=Actinomadura monticuli TaxID=3097367 RepID=A0ABV4QLC7_9ACTN
MKRHRLAVGAGAVLLAGAAPAVPAQEARAASVPSVYEGDARFQILSSTLIRLEYAGDGTFEDRPTFNVAGRQAVPTRFRTWTEGGDRVIRTHRLTLRYKRGSGAFTASNLRVELAGGAVGRPAWTAADRVCSFGTRCEAEDGRAAGGAAAGSDHEGFTGAGFTAGFDRREASASFRLVDVPADGDYRLAARYANARGGDLKDETRTLGVRVGDTRAAQLTLPKTGDWSNWRVAETTVHLRKGDTTISLERGTDDSGHVNVDNLSVVPPGTSYPAYPQLGGYRRGLDYQSGPAKLEPGILSRQGWALLDDSRTALFDPAAHRITQRPGHAGKPYQDGYLFGYGSDYRQALTDLKDLTGPAPLLPRSHFGVWFSRYHPYSTQDYRQGLLPRFRAEEVPLDTLSVDTDFKSPSTWNGWNWNRKLFPAPETFTRWAHDQGLELNFNVHPSIPLNDPQLGETNAIAKGKLKDSFCLAGVNLCKVFDWGDPDQVNAYFALHRPFERQGVDSWWLDWCCEDARVSTRGVTPDSWINYLYAARGDSLGERGHVLSRMGSALVGGLTGQGGSPVYPSGPWAEHRSTVHFTGDSESTWPLLAFAAEMSAAEGSVGMSYVSHDIGSFRKQHLDDDYYTRWIQLGTFQPILRLHSFNGERLPWDYGPQAHRAATKFLQLREALLPYTYSLARQARDTGLPMVRPLYLSYPGQAEAYENSTQYTYGDSLLVAPVTRPNTNGTAQTKVWFPPGRWTDYFTGRTYQGPSTHTIVSGLESMPLFVRAGGIFTQRTNYVDNASQNPLDQVTLVVGAGADGAFTLYEDAGNGQAYQRGEHTTTQITYRSGTIDIAARQGAYPGAVRTRAYTVSLRGTRRPRTVTADGKTLSAMAWSYDTATGTLTIRLPAGPAGARHTIIPIS